MPKVKVMVISSHKASGIDKLSPRMLKLAALIIAPFIAKLINYSFNTPYSQMAAVLGRVIGQTWKRGVGGQKLQIIEEVMSKPVRF